jgi:hypothetical protein
MRAHWAWTEAHVDFLTSKTTFPRGVPQSHWVELATEFAGHFKDDVAKLEVPPPTPSAMQKKWYATRSEHREAEEFGKASDRQDQLAASLWTEN